MSIEELVEDLATAMAEAMESRGTGGIDVGEGYIQWVGFPDGDGLYVEASDGGDYDKPMDAEIVGALARAGWGRPDPEIRNCWFQLDETDDLTQACRLVERAIHVLADRR